MNLSWNDFEMTIAPLVSKFGPKAYDSRKINLIFETVKHLNITQFRRIIDAFVGEDLRAKVSDFRVEAGKVQTKGLEDRCRLCQDSGWIVPGTENQNIDGELIPMRCTCVGGVAAFAKYLRSRGDPNANWVERFFTGVDPEEFFIRGQEIVKHRNKALGVRNGPYRRE